MRRFSDDTVFQASVPPQQENAAPSQLLPWADPYIAMLAEEHRRAQRETSLREARAQAARLVLPRRPPARPGVEASAV